MRTRYRQGTRCVACSLESTSRTGTNLPTRNAMSGTDIAKVRSPSRYDICYIMSSTDKGYQVCTCDAMTSTGIGYVVHGLFVLTIFGADSEAMRYTADI